MKKQEDIAGMVIAIKKIMNCLIKLLNSSGDGNMKKVYGAVKPIKVKIIYLPVVTALFALIFFSSLSELANAATAPTAPPPWVITRCRGALLRELPQIIAEKFMVMMPTQRKP